MSGEPALEMIDVIVYFIVDDCGTITASETQDELFSVHESKGGYCALQLYELTLTVPKPRGCVELTGAVPPDAPQNAPVSIVVTRKE